MPERNKFISIANSPLESTLQMSATSKIEYWQSRNPNPVSAPITELLEKKTRNMGNHKLIHWCKSPNGNQCTCAFFESFETSQ